jgi:hypothetical protein
MVPFMVVHGEATSMGERERERRERERRVVE